MKKIRPEAPGCERELQIGIGGADYRDVDRFADRAAESAHRPLLEHLEQLGLQRLGQQAHFVQKDCAPMRGPKQAGLGLPGIGEGTALEPEQLSLEQGIGNRRAVDVHERAAGARAVPVDQLRDQPFARPSLALNQDRGERPASL